MTFQCDNERGSGFIKRALCNNESYLITIIWFGIFVADRRSLSQKMTHKTVITSGGQVFNDGV
jgi:hypothetical protein